MPQSLFVSVGSRFSMDRLLLAVDQFLVSQTSYHALAQTGKTQATLKHINAQEWFSADAFMQAFLECDIFISHAGMGNILLAAEHNKPIIIMPRRACDGEHINDHQLDTAEGLKDRQFVHSVHNKEELEHAILRLSNTSNKANSVHENTTDWPERTRLINSLHDFYIMTELKKQGAKNHVLIVIINYYCAEQTVDVLQQLEQISKPSNVRLSVICSDNSNKNNANDVANKQHEHNILTEFKQQSSLDLSLIFHSQNLGFGRAINAATANRDFDFLWLVNPDVSLKDHTFEALLTAAQSNLNAGIWGGLTIHQQSEQPDYRHAWREPTLLNTGAWALGLNKFSKAAYWQNNYRNDKHTQHDNTLYSVDSISGCCMFISRAAWQATQGFDRDFFLYSEELDLCHRARSLGFHPTVVTQATLFHAQEGTNNNAQRLRFLHYAKLLYANKHHGMLYQLCYRAEIALGAGIRAIIFSVKNKPEIAQQWRAILILTLCRSTDSIKQYYSEHYDHPK